MARVLRISTLRREVVRSPLEIVRKLRPADLPDEGVHVVVEQCERTDEGIGENIVVLREVSFEAQLPERNGIETTGPDEGRHVPCSWLPQVAKQRRVSTRALDVVPIVEVHHDDVLNTVHDSMPDRPHDQRNRRERQAVPEEIARSEEKILTRIDRTSFPQRSDHVPDIEDEIDRGERPRRGMKILDHFGRRRESGFEQQSHPETGKHFGHDQHVHEQDPIEIEVEPGRSLPAGARLEIVDSAKTVLLHDAVLVIPEGQDEDQTPWIELAHPGNGRDQDQRTGDEAPGPTSQFRR